MADARERINVRIKAARAKQPAAFPKRLAPKPYPLAGEDDGLWSCDESDVGTDADEVLVRGPAIDEVDVHARRTVRPSAQSQPPLQSRPPLPPPPPPQQPSARTSGSASGAAGAAGRRAVSAPARHADYAA